MAALSSSSTSYSSSDSSSDLSSSHAKRRHHRSNRRDRDRESLKIRNKSHSLEVTVLRILSMSSIIQRLLVEEGDRPKKLKEKEQSTSHQYKCHKHKVKEGL
ncbi:uncharacterized protein LOC111297894 isoform X2 [Durio zibethinus]|uniref:Uncharacterized protein LOC111297894 isoform X2 n=1 Tax=Durio zibethinus TaxID=66656 RepID=A0A6P5Z6L0_DURZI|nr:uncharacterized protein LOC111297894 isoform X2 [Durio zibethinus]